MARTLATLTSAPHRVLFLAGAIQVVLAMAYWLAALLDGLGILHTLPATAVPAPAAHGWLMLYGVFPFFIFGFLFTAAPNWLSVPAPPRPAYLAVALPMAVGALLFYPGLYLPALAAAAIGLHLLGWLAALRILWGLLHASRPSPAAASAGLGSLAVVAAQPVDRRHAQAALLACSLGALGEAAWLHGLLTATPLAWRLAESLGVWGFLTPTFLAVCHRMIPWFTGRVVQNYVMVRPSAALWGMLAACLVHAALESADLTRWLWLADLPLAGLLLWLTVRWHAPAAYRVRLLAMLHMSLPWAVLAVTLYAVDSLASRLGAGWSLGHAPLHALGIGFFASMLVAMASRVSLGHSGRKLEADGLTWAVFWSIQATALVRLLPDVLPGTDPTPWMILAALGWLTAFTPWVWRYGPFYWRARVDGKPG